MTTNPILVIYGMTVEWTSDAFTFVDLVWKTKSDKGCRTKSKAKSSELERYCGD